MAQLTELEATIILAARMLSHNPAHLPRQAALRKAIAALDAAHLAPGDAAKPRPRRAAAAR